MDRFDELYDIYVQSLFIMPFDEILKKYSNSNYEWVKFEKIFRQMYNLILESKDENDLLKNYYMFTILYLNYTNYLKYSQNPDFNNQEIYKILNKIKFNKNILKKLLTFTPNTNIKKIIKITNPFVNLKLRSNKFNNEDYLNKFINEYLINSKQMEKLAEMSNDNFKKCLNIIIFRNMICKKNKYDNYHDFFYKKIIESKDLNILLDFETFMNKIPFSKKILDIKTKNSDFNINIGINEIIKFLSAKISKLSIENNKNEFIISNSKYGGKIVISFDSNLSSTEFNNYQINYSLIHFGLEELKKFNFLKKTSSFIEIKFNSPNIKDLSSLLDTIHLLTISFKILESYPEDIYECIYPVEYTNYYFLSFCMFFEFIKPHIKTSPGINKFIIDLLKYFYIYAYYDYYFYYSKNLFDAMITTFAYKNNIFEDFVNSLKTTLKIPKELFAYPPFFDIEDDLNSVLYYSFEIPSYFKLFDFINAICYVFDKNYYITNYKNFDFVDIIKKHFIILDFIEKNKSVKKNILSSDSLINTAMSQKPNNSKKKYRQHIESSNTSSLDYLSSGSKRKSNKNTLNSSDNSKSNTSVSDTVKSNDDLKSRLNNDQISNMSKKEKKLMHNTNTYIELNIENSINYDLITDIK